MYDLYFCLQANDGNITSVHAQRLSWRGGKQMSALIILAKMATALGKVQSLCAAGLQPVASLCERMKERKNE